jgi:hypothetical protein
MKNKIIFNGKSMKSKRKILIIIIVFVIFIFVERLISISISIRQDSALRSFEDEVANILLPPEIEKIAVKSAIGDAGGNNDYSTIRVVLVVKTDLDINELETTIKTMDLPFVISIEITRCKSSIFQSWIEFTLVFDELLGINDYNNYFFVEFIRRI